MSPAGPEAPSDDEEPRRRDETTERSGRSDDPPRRDVPVEEDGTETDGDRAPVDRSAVGDTAESRDDTDREYDGSTGTGGDDGVAIDESRHRVGRPGDAPATDRSEEDGGFGAREFAYDILSSVVAVALVGFFLFAVSGVWPPLVAVESPSMDPHMQKGDLVFVMDEKRFAGEGAHGDTGVVTARDGDGEYTKFKQSGDVIVFKPNGDNTRTPIIHRAMFWVDEGENWYEKADRQYLGGAGDCSELPHCPANRAGFVTIGDNNGVYDQARPALEPVRPEWIVGTAELRIPALGWVRLRSGAAMSPGNATAVAG